MVWIKENLDSEQKNNAPQQITNLPFEPPFCFLNHKEHIILKYYQSCVMIWCVIDTIMNLLQTILL